MHRIVVALKHVASVIFLHTLFLKNKDAFGMNDPGLTVDYSHHRPTCLLAMSESFVQSYHGGVYD